MEKKKRKTPAADLELAYARMRNVLNKKVGRI
jgi:phage-related protein